MRRRTETLLVTGGCRSGKSRYAQRWAEARGVDRLFLATSHAIDNEMAERIRRHRSRRGRGWDTVESPEQVVEILRDRMAKSDVVLVDCITIWVSNLMLAGLTDSAILQRVDELVDTLPRLRCSVGMVTNEVGWGVVPDHPLGRRFRDLAGTVNQRLAAAVDRVVLLVAGISLTVKDLGRPTEE
jgi:adenosylcobinamide kinase/adenosylcobinamide-phosphate guanylyltransferase